MILSLFQTSLQDIDMHACMCVCERERKCVRAKATEEEEEEEEDCCTAAFLDVSGSGEDELLKILISQPHSRLS